MVIRLQSLNPMPTERGKKNCYLIIRPQFAREPRQASYRATLKWSEMCMRHTATKKKRIGTN